MRKTTTQTDAGIAYIGIGDGVGASLWAASLTTAPLAERLDRLTKQGARFELLPGEQNDPLVRKALAGGVARTFRDGGTWLELAD